MAKLFDKSTLLQLKNECGGLQTLLRNHYYIFKGELNLDSFDVVIRWTLTIVLVVVQSCLYVICYMRTKCPLTHNIYRNYDLTMQKMVHSP